MPKFPAFDLEYNIIWNVCRLSCFICVWLFAALWTVPSRFLCPWDSPGKNIGLGCHSLLQGIFPMQGLNMGLLHCRQILYSLSPRETQVERRYQRKILKEVPQAKGKWYHVEIYLNFCTVILHLPVKSLILAITTMLYKAVFVQLFVSTGTCAISFSSDSEQALVQAMWI